MKWPRLEDGRKESVGFFDWGTHIDAFAHGRSRRFRPSMDIADAFEVVARLNAERVYVCVQNHQDGGWQAFVGASWEPVEADSAPEAICRAALNYAALSRESASKTLGVGEGDHA